MPSSRRIWANFFGSACCGVMHAILPRKTFKGKTTEKLALWKTLPTISINKNTEVLWGPTLLVLVLKVTPAQAAYLSVWIALIGIPGCPRRLDIGCARPAFFSPSRPAVRWRLPAICTITKHAAPCHGNLQDLWIRRPVQRDASSTLHSTRAMVK